MTRTKPSTRTPRKGGRWKWRRDLAWSFPRWECRGWAVWEHNGRWYIIGKVRVLMAPCGKPRRFRTRLAAQLAAEKEGSR
jgi:hypothetical protein